MNSMMSKRIRTADGDFEEPHLVVVIQLAEYRERTSGIAQQAVPIEIDSVFLRRYRRDRGYLRVDIEPWSSLDFVGKVSRLDGSRCFSGE